MEVLSTKRAVPPLAAAFRSKKDAVRDALRDGIAQGAFKPGERLVIDDLAAQFGVSPIPVREALQQLQAEGFVELQPHVGATVTRIEPALITEIFELLAALELISGRAACQNMSKDDFARMEVMLREMDRLQADLDAWSAANVRLHQFICDCAGMPLVKSTLTKVLDHWDRLRRHYLNDVFAHRVRVAHRDHWQMFRAMRGCDVDRLERIVHEHNRAARDAYTEQFQRALERDSARG
jgi:DNA-binding GntR family transcriptional regulator